METESNGISEVTRRDILDAIRVGETKFHGRLSEIEFLDRVFDLDEMPSTDRRFPNMRGDIHQHTVSNHDWEPDWIFSDVRLDLHRCADPVFLRFLSEIVHPVARPLASEARALVKLFNESLKSDGWEFVEAKQLSGKPVFAARRTDAVPQGIPEKSEFGSAPGQSAKIVAKAGIGGTSGASAGMGADSQGEPMRNDGDAEEPPSDPKYDYSQASWRAPATPSFESVSDKAAEMRAAADVVLMTATEVELRQVLRLMKPQNGGAKIRKIHVGLETYYLGKFGRFQAATTMCSMGSTGPISSEQTARSALERWRPKALLLVGIAWGAEKLKHLPGDVLVASQIVPYEAQRVGESIVFRGPIAPTGPTLLNRFRNALDWQFARPDGSMVNVHYGKVLSGEKLIDDPEFKKSLLKQFPEAIGGEMEGAGVYASTSRQRTEWILVKSVCDWADGRKRKDYQEMAAASAASLAESVLSDADCLDGLGQPEPKRRAPRRSRPSRALSSRTSSQAGNPGIGGTPSTSFHLSTPLVAPSPTAIQEAQTRLQAEWSASEQVGRRRFWLQAYPSSSCLLHGLGIHSDSETRRAFQTPPVPRSTGFGLGISTTPEVVPGGGLRIVQRRHCRSLTRSGLLTWSAAADRDFLAWAAKKGESENNINPLALIEATYSFFVLFLQYVLPALEPRTATWVVTGGMTDLLIDKPPSRLCAGILHPQFGGFGKDWHDAPANDIPIAMTRSTIEPGEAAYGVLEEIYEQWGLGAKAIPYCDGKRVDPTRFPGA